MPNISTLTVRLSANSARLVAELNKAQQRAKTFSDRVSGTLKVAGRSFAAFGATGSVALIGLARAGVTAGDQLAKTAAKLGLAADELAGLRFAAEQTGANIRTLDLGLQRMVRRVAEAAQGTGEAQKALKELGLDARQLAAQSPAEQFRLIADAFADVSNQADVVRLGFKLFDSEGVALVNTLAAGREGLDAFRAEAERLGLALDAVQLANIQKAADSQNRLSRAIGGFSRQLGAVFAPALSLASDATASFVATMTQSIPRVAAFASAVLGLSRSIDTLTLAETRAELEAVFRELVNAQSQLINVQRGVRSAFDGRGYISESERENVRRAADEVARLVTRSQELQLRMREGTAETAALTRTLGALPSGGGEAAVALFEKASRELDEFIASQDRLQGIGARIFSQTRTPVENFVSRMREAREALNAGFIDQDTFDRYKSNMLDNVIAPMNVAARTGSKSFDQIDEAAKQAARNIQDSFADFLFDPFDKGVKGMLQSFLDAVRRMIANQAATQLFSAIRGAFRSATEPLELIDISGLPKRRQFGGPVTAGAPYLVGEDGPELFVPRNSGNVMPNNKLTGGQVINLSVSTSVDARGSTDADRIEQTTPILVNEAVRQSVNAMFELRAKGKF